MQRLSWQSFILQVHRLDFMRLLILELAQHLLLKERFFVLGIPHNVDRVQHIGMLWMAIAIQHRHARCQSHQDGHSPQAAPTVPN